jgi:hypothetical protein
LPGHSYLLLAGNSAAPGPQYDLGARLERQEWSDVRGTLGALETNGAFDDNRPIFDRYPWIPLALFGFLSLLLLMLGVRAMRRRGLDPGPDFNRPAA